MEERRKKPGGVFWTTVILVGVPVLYVASLGPIVRWGPMGGIAGAMHYGPPWQIVYYLAPADWVYDNAPEPVPTALKWYVSLWNRG